MNKNVVILTVILFGLVVGLAAMLILGKNPSAPKPAAKTITTQDIDKNIAELNSLDADTASFAKDNIILEEMDTTLNEVGEITEATASLTNEEANLNSLDSDLTGLIGDEKINQAIDQSLQDVAL